MVGKEPYLGTWYGSDGVRICSPITEQPVVRDLSMGFRPGSHYEKYDMRQRQV